MTASGRRERWVAVLAGTLVVLAGLRPGLAQAQRRAQEPGAVVGRVVEAGTGESVGWTQILLEGAGRSTASDGTGAFRIIDVPAGAYTLKTARVGYEPLARTVAVPPGDTLRLTLRLSASPIEAGEIVVEGEREVGLTEPAVQLEGRRLRQDLGATIAETLDEEPGIAMRSMGPAPARPVLRGLGGERLLVLEDGGRTGDLSATSSDHAVVIEPMTAERIEVVRGPEALIYGPSVLGGAVNVVRGYIPSSRPAQARFELSTQGETVSQGYSTGLIAAVPVGLFAVRADGSLRQAQDVQTPAGELDNTALGTYSGSLGASLVRRHGYVGMAGSLYRSGYGIPGGFVGAHPSGVDIELDRRHVEVKGEAYPHSRRFPRLEARGTYSRYHHEEFEASGALGIEFGVLSYHASLIGYTGPLGPLRKGAVGLWGAYRDYASGGFSFTPPTVERTVAGFAYQEAAFDALTLRASLRFDYRTVDPAEEEESRLVGLVRRRTFGGLSAAASGTWRVRERLSAGLMLMRSLRLPGIEELYSEGPHLAAYSFEVGNPELGLERGWGTEAFGRYRTSAASFSLALYHNYILDYIYPRNTGRPSRVQLPIYQYTGETVRMLGGEASASWQLGGQVEAEGALSYVRGTLVEVGEPLPQMPPLHGRLGLSYRLGPLTLSARVRGATEQDRLGAFEEPTAGYAVLDAFAQLYFPTGRLLHTLDLGVENATDTEYRDHLSRVKVIMPEPGRNIKLLYKVFF